MVKIILVISALGFIGLGGVCLNDPSVIARWAGYQFVSADAWIEARSMYGGLQLSLGIFSMLGVFIPSMRSAALLLNALIYIGLFAARLFAYYASGGPEVGGFVVAALWLEGIMSVIMTGAYLADLAATKK